MSNIFDRTSNTAVADLATTYTVGLNNPEKASEFRKVSLGDLAEYCATTMGLDNAVPPGLDPTDRTARVATEYNSTLMPGLNAGETVEYRRQMGVFDSNRDAATRNSAIFEGFNIKANGQNNPLWGTIGSGAEFSFQPSSPAETWGEKHAIRFFAPGGTETRPVSALCSWTTGATRTVIIGTTMNFLYHPTVGADETIFTFSGTSVTVTGNGFYSITNGTGGNLFRQLNGAADGFISLNYVNSSDEVVRGYDNVTGLVPIGRERGIHFSPVAEAAVPTPSDGRTLFFDSGTSKLTMMDSARSLTVIA